VCEAVGRGLVELPRRGLCSDDLLLETEEGYRYLVASRASLAGRRYLRRSVSKASCVSGDADLCRRRLYATIAVGGGVHGFPTGQDRQELRETPKGDWVNHEKHDQR